MPIYFSAFRSILLSYSEIFFLKNAVIGFFILLVTLVYPNHGVSGLFSIIVAYSFARYVGYQKEFLKSGHYTYNALLVGLSVGQLFSFSPLSAIYIAIAAILTFLITVAMADIFSRYLLLPILSIPFVMVTSLIYLSAARFSNLYVNELYAQGHIQWLADAFPLWLSGLFKSMGAIIFMPSNAAGLFLLLLVLIHSRVLFLLAVAGYYFGVFLQGAFTGSYIAAFNDLNAFNYPLIAMAIGGVFNIPTIKSYSFAMMGVAGATVLIKSIDIFWSQYGIPVFTLPFILITLGFVYVLGLLQYKFRPLVFKDTPEETAEYFYTQQLRYATTTPFRLPFLDQWSVYQGFDGEWTHQGIWKYAYDFVKRDEKGLTFQNEGKYLSDYYCFKQQVSSPCRGYVVYTLDSLPDNPVGVIDTLNNWGNYIVIQDERGYYVGLCHLAQYSLLVKPGDWVDVFQPVALCGNSGYSPQPHLHMQYQTTSMLSSATIPFCFSGVLKEQKFLASDVPENDANVLPAFPQPFYMQLANFILDEKLKFKVYYRGEYKEDITFKVKMAVDSTFFLEHGESRLYFGKTDASFYFYHLEGNSLYLKLLYQALPSMPLSYMEKHSWQDVVPEKYLGGWVKKVVNEMKQLVHVQMKKNATYRFTSDHCIEGKIQVGVSSREVKTEIKLDPYVKFDEIRVGDYLLTHKKQ